MHGNIRNFFGAAALATTLLSQQAEAQQPKVTFEGGSKFEHQISSNHAPGSRTITVDCTRMEPITLKDGTKRLAATVAFIDSFNLLNAEGMSAYSAREIKAIEEAGNNRSTNPSSVKFLVHHVVTAHGVKYPEISSAGKKCEAAARFE